MYQYRGTLLEIFAKNHSDWRTASAARTAIGADNKSSLSATPTPTHTGVETTEPSPLYDSSTGTAVAPIPTHASVAETMERSTPSTGVRRLSFMSTLREYQATRTTSTTTKPQKNDPVSYNDHIAYEVQSRPDYRVTP